MREKALNVVADYFSRDVVDTLLADGGDAAVGTAVDTESYELFTALFEATGVSTGATVRIEGQLKSGGTWFTVFDQAFTSTGVAFTRFAGPFYALRATVPTGDFTDGLYTVTLRSMR